MPTPEGELDKSNLVNFTFRIEPKQLKQLELYSRTLGKSQSQIIRELVSSALSTIPDHHKQAMSTIVNCRASL
ncbi:MAG: ribbon-helix-helix protein, CopG family [Komarekiella atlantica HA4396-MV6]|jgi:predicted DNA-binding protein|nr:ribbon-helix-helix protein, CopG family [Komarekiella atlantica HA4396-MV6]